jgi:hypothetical protein
MLPDIYILVDFKKILLGDLKDYASTCQYHPKKLNELPMTYLIIQLTVYLSIPKVLII